MPMTLATRHIAVRLAFALLIAAHGVAHFSGVSGDITSIGDGHSLELFGGASVVSNRAVLTLFALAWAVLGTCYVIAAMAVWRRGAQARRALLWLATASLLLSIISLWAAALGVLINTAILLVSLRTPEMVGLRVEDQRGRSA